MIKGAKELDRKLAVAGNISIVKPVAKATSYVQTQAKKECPTNDGELRNSILLRIHREGEHYAEGTVHTGKKYAGFVEFGTGPKGQESHAGISPNVDVAYSQSPWWIHESQIDRNAAEKYHWFYIDTQEGRFYQCSGQAAQPFLYPALKNNKDTITGIIRDELKKEIRRTLK